MTDAGRQAVSDSAHMDVSLNKIVLVLSADSNLGATLRCLLTPYGINVQVVSPAETTSLDLLHVDLFILDLSPSAEQEFALLEFIRLRCPQVLGRTVVLSGLNYDLTTLLGEIVVLQKPFDVMEMLDVVGLLTAYPVRRELGAGWKGGRLAPKVIPRPKKTTTNGIHAKRLTGAGSTRPVQKSTSGKAESREMRQVTIYGDLHGKGYRFFATGAAMQLGLAGWIQDAPGGTVRAWVEGERGAIDAWIAALREGSRYAKVTRIEQEVGAFTGEFKEFEVKL